MATTNALRSPVREDLLAHVQRLSPLLSELAGRAEEQRTLPLECVEAMRDAGLFAMAAPEIVGGLEVDPLTQMEIIEAVSRIDTSAGWTLMIGSHGALVFGIFASDAACQRIFDSSRWPIGASQIAPYGGRFRRVPGGFQITGRWSFGTGIRHADWAMVTATAEETPAQGQSPVQIAAVVPANQVTVIDNWNVAGLRGTGSCDYELADVFVTEDMTWPFPPTVQRGGPRYLLKVPQVMLACFALGAAQRSVDEITAQARAKYRPSSPSAVATRPYFHHALGASVMRLEGARAALHTLVGDAWTAAREGIAPTRAVEDRLNAAPAFVFDVAREVTSTAWRFGGSSSGYLDNVLQRNFRDVAMGGQHFHASEASYEALGRSLLDIDALAAGG